MISFVPSADTLSGRLLGRLGHLLGLRSETVYSRAILLVTMVFFAIGGGVIAWMSYELPRQFEMADEQAARDAAVRVRTFLEASGETKGAPSRHALTVAAQLQGRTVRYVAISPLRAIEVGAAPGGALVEHAAGGFVTSSFLWPPGEGAAAGGEVQVEGGRAFYDAGVTLARWFLGALAVAGGVMLLLIVIIVDRTILRRVKSLAGKVENEKLSERLPVKLDFPGEDELAQLARSIEELAVLVQAGEREYRNVVEDQTESICRFDREGRITFHNRAFDELCRVPPAGRRPFLSFCLDEPTSRLIGTTLESLAAGRETTSFTHAMARESGRVWYRSTLRANFDPAGQLLGGQWIATDVTTEVVAQQRLEESQRQLKYLSGRLLDLQDAERRRIARDLHDSTAQSLSALEMNMSVLEGIVKDGKAAALMAETRDISRQVCSELRNISYLLHPPLLDERGLAFAIRWFAGGFTKRNNIPVQLDLADPFPRLETEVETALFRVVQEALSNIYRHAGASKAWIHLEWDGEEQISLEVRDNGEGLPETFSFSQSAGVGLAGMRERMNQLGGALEVVSSPYGVSVECTLRTKPAHASR